jgi:hypothetical protein
LRQQVAGVPVDDDDGEVHIEYRASRCK